MKTAAVFVMSMLLGVALAIPLPSKVLSAFPIIYSLLTIQQYLKPIKGGQTTGSDAQNQGQKDNKGGLLGDVVSQAVKPLEEFAGHRFSGPEDFCGKSRFPNC